MNQKHCLLLDFHKYSKVLGFIIRKPSYKIKYCIKYKGLEGTKKWKLITYKLDKNWMLLLFKSLNFDEWENNRWKNPPYFKNALIYSILTGSSTKFLVIFEVLITRIFIAKDIHSITILATTIVYILELFFSSYHYAESTTNRISRFPSLGIPRLELENLCWNTYVGQLEFLHRNGFPMSNVGFSHFCPDFCLIWWFL